MMLRGWIGPEFRGAAGLGHRAGPRRRARPQEGSGAADAFELFSWNRQAGSPWRQNSPIWLRSSCERGHGAGSSCRCACNARVCGSFTCDDITVYDATCAVDINRRMPGNRVCLQVFRAASSPQSRSPQSWRRHVFDRNPAADAAVGSIECSGTCISRQSSDCAQGHAVSRFRRGEITAGPRGPSSGAAEYFRKLRSLLRFL